MWCNSSFQVFWPIILKEHDLENQPYTHLTEDLFCVNVFGPNCGIAFKEKCTSYFQDGCMDNFQSYQDDGRRILKGCMQWNPVYG